MNEKIIKAANEITQKIEELPVDSTFRFADYFNEYDFEQKEEFELMREILRLCESKNIKVNNTQEGAVIGMPWAATYIKQEN